MSASKLRRQLRNLIKACKDKPCMDCELTYPSEEMSYDHVRGIKFFNLGGSLGHRSEQEVRREIAKCEVVCIWCHRKREASRKDAAA